ncbi:thiamine phosphate synthase [bacterium SCSIO 12741]|nr:thiamine phosphate synthase [bacterium SCSIO 12741]
MKLIVISSPNKSKSEIRHIIGLFEAGLEVFHIKKSDFSRKQMKAYLQMIPRKYHGQLVLHSHYDLAPKFGLKGIHLSKSKRRKSDVLRAISFWYAKVFTPGLKVSKSFHSIQSLINDKGKYEYVFLSPVFDRHDIQEFSAAFSEKQLRSVLFKTHHKVFALGGIRVGRVELARRTGFDGVALHSAIWKEKKDKMARFNELKTEVERVSSDIS